MCVLTYANYPHLARQVIESIRVNCPRSGYELIVGANDVCPETAEYLQQLQSSGELDHLILSPVNLNKNPMMREMFKKVGTPFVWWFDDDSYITDFTAFDRWLAIAEESQESTVMWGQMAWCDHSAAFAPDLADPVGWVRGGAWYRGLPPPSWRPGGKGQFNFGGLGAGDGRWVFVVGGCWLARTSALRAMDWPDKRLTFSGEDALLGEAVRQQGWIVANIENLGVSINSEPRRGNFHLMSLAAQKAG